MKAEICRFISVKSTFSHQKKLIYMFILIQIRQLFYIDVQFYNNFYNLEMQKSALFRSCLKKKQLIQKMVSQTRSPRNKQSFQHFQAISQPTYIRAQSNAMYLSHLNGEFKDNLRQFVHQNESFQQTMSQLCIISEKIENQRDDLQGELRKYRTQLNQLQLQKAILEDKNNFHLDKIMTLEQQNKGSQIRYQEYQKIATDLQQENQYELCIVNEIKTKNSQLIQKLQIKSCEIQGQTLQMQNNQKDLRRKESQLKKINQSIKSIYFTLQSQDNSLSVLCDSIQTGLNQQSNHINDIQFIKNDLSHILTQSSKRRKQIQQQENTQNLLLNCLEDLTFDLKRTQMELLTEQKGIDQEYWKIQQQKSRICQNQQMLVELQQYLTQLIRKNGILQQTLEEQIIQDHTIKKIVDSKCCQPVGMKTKQFLQQYEQKQMESTGSSFKQNLQSHSKVSYKQKKSSQIDAHKGPQQMEFVFEKYSKLNPIIIQKQNQVFHQYFEQQMKLNQTNEASTGLSYIKLKRFQMEV